jgi:hypothetical protein
MTRKDMKTAKELLAEAIANGTFKPPTAVTPLSLYMRWQRNMCDRMPDESPLLTPKERAQLKMFFNKVGPDRAVPALDFVFAHWPEFEARATGEPCAVSAVPRVGFLLKYRDALISMMNG